MTVRRLREAQRLPYTELSERLTALGHPIPVLGLRRIEKGERRVDIDELAALARALEVPPLTLIFPIGAADRIEILPGQVHDVWPAAMWFTSEGPFPGDLKYADFNAWQRAGEPVRLFREHERLLQELQIELMHVATDRDSVGEATSDDQRATAQRILDETERRVRACQKALLDHRREMRQRGVTPPPAAEVANIERGDG